MIKIPCHKIFLERIPAVLLTDHTLLQICADCGSKECLQFLLEQVEVEIDARDINGNI